MPAACPAVPREAVRRLGVVVTAQDVPYGGTTFLPTEANQRLCRGLCSRRTSTLTMLPWLPPERREPCPLPGRPRFLHYAKMLRKHLHLNQQVKTQGQREAIQVHEEAEAFS